MGSLLTTGFCTFLIGCISTAAFSQSMTTPKATIHYIQADFSVKDLDHSSWKNAKEIPLDSYWNGETAPSGRRSKVRLLWSSSGLYVRFDASQEEPLVVNERPQLEKKTMRLWDRDVVEIFLAPDRSEPRKYLEFEVAPTGEWIDLAIDYTGPNRQTDWEFNSRMESAAKIEKERIVMAMKIPWSAFGSTPKPGDVWPGNLFRCVGKDPTRGYLAWRPTMTEQPNFHVPDKFGNFEFKK